MSSRPDNPIIRYYSAIGDSITNSDTSLYIAKAYQYPKLVKNLVGGNCRERNLGIPGDTSAMALARINNIMRFTPTVASIYLGINDKASSVDTSVFSANLQTFIDTLKNAGCTRIILCNIHTMQTSDATYDTYRTVIQNVATSNNVAFCNLHDVILESADYQGDGLHLTTTGISKLASKIKEAIDVQGWTTILQN